MNFDPDLCRRYAVILLSPQPSCTCTGWFDVDHELACARRQHRLAIEDAIRGIPAQLNAAADLAPLLQSAGERVAELEIALSNRLGQPDDPDRR